MTSNDNIPTDNGFTTPTASWFKPAITLEEIPKPALDLLIRFTGLPLDEIAPHVNEARTQAWKTAPYPCIGLYMYLDLPMSQHPLYPRLLSRLLLTTTPPTRLLDIGCGLGQDVRKLHFDGVPARHIYAVDVEAGLLRAGQELFMDGGGGGGREGIAFLQGDVVADEAGLWKERFGVDDGFEIIHTGALLHLFSWETQLVIGRKVVGLVGAQAEAVIFGWTFAAREAGFRAVGANREAKVFGHNEESVRRFWNEVGEMTGTRWGLEVRFDWTDGSEDAGLARGGKWGNADGNGLMWFSVHRV